MVTSASDEATGEKGTEVGGDKNSRQIGIVQGRQSRESMIRAFAKSSEDATGELEEKKKRSPAGGGLKRRR